jgi:hypothetical protein
MINAPLEEQKTGIFSQSSNTQPLGERLIKLIFQEQQALSFLNTAVMMMLVEFYDVVQADPTKKRKLKK